MLPYYARHDLLWLDAGFDQAWHWRDNRVICRDTVSLGYISLSRDTQALFIRELHLLPAHRVRAWVNGCSNRSHCWPAASACPEYD